MSSAKFRPVKYGRHAWLSDLDGRTRRVIIENFRDVLTKAEIRQAIQSGEVNLEEVPGCGAVTRQRLAQWLNEPDHQVRAQIEKAKRLLCANGYTVLPYLISHHAARTGRTQAHPH